jgi:hypothetical protein
MLASVRMLFLARHTHQGQCYIVMANSGVPDRVSDAAGSARYVRIARVAECGREADNFHTTPTRTVRCDSRIYGIDSNLNKDGNN